MSALEDFEHAALSALVPAYVLDDVIEWAESIRMEQALLELVLERQVQIIGRDGSGLLFQLAPESEAVSETEQ